MPSISHKFSIALTAALPLNSVEKLQGQTANLPAAKPGNEIRTQLSLIFLVSFSPVKLPRKLGPEAGQDTLLRDILLSRAF